MSAPPSARRPPPPAPASGIGCSSCKYVPRPPPKRGRGVSGGSLSKSAPSAAGSGRSDARLPPCLPSYADLGRVERMIGVIFLVRGPPLPPPRRAPLRFFLCGMDPGNAGGARLPTLRSRQLPAGRSLLPPVRVGGTLLPSSRGWRRWRVRCCCERARQRRRHLGQPPSRPRPCPALPLPVAPARAAQSAQRDPPAAPPAPPRAPCAAARSLCAGVTILLLVAEFRGSYVELVLPLDNSVGRAQDCNCFYIFIEQPVQARRLSSSPMHSPKILGRTLAQPI
jgi:hypothetical protein